MPITNEAGGCERWPFDRSSTSYECRTHLLKDNDIVGECTEPVRTDRHGETSNPMGILGPRGVGVANTLNSSLEELIHI